MTLPQCNVEWLEPDFPSCLKIMIKVEKKLYIFITTALKSVSHLETRDSDLWEKESK
jgi:hypothetical protein